MAAENRALDFDRVSMPELVCLARAGHRQAFEQIITRSNQRLFRVARAIMNDDFEAEDALQEAYIRGFDRLDSFRGEAHFTTWLTRILLNECYGRLRRRRESISLDTLENDTDTAHLVSFIPRHGMENPANTTGRLEVRELLESTIAALAEDFRVVFVMREVEGFTTEETAEMLGIKPQTVKTRLFRARRTLRKTLHRQLRPTLGEAFPFLGSRCANFTAIVMRRLENENFFR
ncbi:MAG: RNA polymerase sigma factor [Halioglobus sp.]|nr:RNA polymerase sigma factor [Halioglobus sp.]